MYNNYNRIAEIYVDALRQSDLNIILNLFDDSAVVLSPVYGEVPAFEFYPKLFNETYQSILNIKNVFFDPDYPRRIALYFAYGWTLSNKRSFQFDVVDIIEFNETGKIEKIKIIYDASQTKPAVENLKSAMALDKD